MIFADYGEELEGCPQVAGQAQIDDGLSSLGFVTQAGKFPSAARYRPVETTVAKRLPSATQPMVTTAAAKVARDAIQADVRRQKEGRSFWSRRSQIEHSRARYENMEKSKCEKTPGMRWVPGAPIRGGGRRVGRCVSRCKTDQRWEPMEQQCVPRQLPPVQPAAIVQGEKRAHSEEVAIAKARLRAVRGHRRKQQIKPESALPAPVGLTVKPGPRPASAPSVSSVRKESAVSPAPAQVVTVRPQEEVPFLDRKAFGNVKWKHLLLVGGAGAAATTAVVLLRR